MAADTVVREQRLRDVREDGRALLREVELRADQARVLEADLAAAREAHAAATGRAAAAEARATALEARATALEGETAWIARERDAFASRLGAAESVAAWMTRRVAELDDAIAERDRRLAGSKRLAVRRARAAARALEAARAEEAARLAALEDELHGKLAAEEARTARLQAQNEELRAGRVYRLAGRWWRLRRRLGGGPKSPRAK
jgi:chromosome segregation ATPase